MPKFYDHAGNLQDVQLDVSVYREAADAKMSVPQYINTKYPTDAKKYGTAFEQFMASESLFLRADKNFGIKPPTMKEVFDGRPQINAGAITREAQPASRILFPAVFLEYVENALPLDVNSYLSQFEKMIALTDTVNGSRLEQPVLNYSKPEAARSQGISQLSLPQSMLSITVSDVARSIPTFSLGLEISNEALQASSLDLVSLALRRQREIELISRAEGYITAWHDGDTDMLGMAALPVVNADVHDTSIAATGVLTHLAWVKWLRTNFRRRHIDYVMCDLATALAIENRTGKPTIATDDPKSPRINPLAEVMNPQWQNVKIFLLEDGTIPANHIMGIDSRYAVRRVRNAQADYAAVEQFVLRKSQAMRFDFGEITYRQFDDAFEVMALINT
jgi:hypothetical protein